MKKSSEKNLETRSDGNLARKSNKKCDFKKQKKNLWFMEQCGDNLGLLNWQVVEFNMFESPEMEKLSKFNILSA